MGNRLDLEDVGAFIERVLREARAGGGDEHG